nr:histone-like nucleoid-structuring protein, MvaT/MvaU family [Pseudomonas putida]
MFVTPCHRCRTGVITVSRLAEFRAAEKALQEQMAQLEALKKDAGLKREIEFEQKLVGLMKSYDKSLRDIIAILDPKAVTRGAAPSAPKQQRRPRVVKVYENPHTGELIETKGGNHRGLKAWKEQYGAGTVESWLR